MKKKSYYSKLETAMQLNVCVRTLDSLMSKGAISYVKVGKRVIFTQQDIDEFITRNRKIAFAEVEDLDSYIHAEQQKLVNK